MRIASRIFAVGAIPIAIAAGIAIAAILLLNDANRARSSAITAGTVFRTILTAVNVRNEYLQAAPETRAIHAEHFFRVAERAKATLGQLRDMGRVEDRATRDVGDTLKRFVDGMDMLVAVTGKNDAMIRSMAARAASLMALTDQARARQHASNADIVASIADGDKQLRQARDTVDGAYAVRLAVAAVQAEELELKVETDAARLGEIGRMLRFDVTRLGHTAGDLVRLLQAKNGDTAAAVAGVRDVDTRIEALKTAVEAGPVSDLGPADRSVVRDLARWAEQLLKINAAEYRSFHEEASQLLAYSIQAHETELATQNVAIETLKLSNRAADALNRRDGTAARLIFDQSEPLPATIAALPISPLIQSEMGEAVKLWRDGLGTATDGLREQNGLLTRMDEAATNMIDAARSIDTSYSQNAEANGRSVGLILILGAATGLLLGASAAFFVARSITQPLKHLQSRMTALAADPDAESIADEGRRDELGDMARATNTFLVEIARRERAIKTAKERADAALETLQQTQAELIQVEKLASLGQLVAGVAHEINTPIGIALTTSTVIEDETRVFKAAARDGRISRNALDRLVERVAEGSHLLAANLTRAADLIQSFKHVAADQVSGEQRVFEVRSWLNQLLTSLGPMLRKAGHGTTVECPEGLMLDTYPGALGQVVTNLVVNASLHAFDKGRAGTITLAVHENGADALRFVVSDNGCGIKAEHRGKIFDPFFTTRRPEGSTGLGLHIVFNLVTSTLGGRIYFDTVPGTGTRFTIDLPLIIKPHAPRGHRQVEAAT